PAVRGCSLLVVPRRLDRNAGRGRHAGRTRHSGRVAAFGPGLQTGLEGGLDELVQVAIEDLVRVTAFDASAQVLDARLVEHVVADLVAPADVRLAGFQRILRGIARLQFRLVQLAGQHLHGAVAVGMLAALGLAGHHDTGRNVGDAHRRFGLVDVLAAGTGRAVHIRLQVGRIDIDVDPVVHLRADEHGGEAGVTAVVRVEGALPHQAVHTGLGLQPAVGIVPLDTEGGRLDAGDLTAADLDQ